MIRAVLFDFGGVLTSSPFDGFADYERSAGLPIGFLRRVNSTSPDTNAWARFERSEIDRATFEAAFEAEAEALGHRVDASQVLASMATGLRPRMVEALRRCAERYRTALLTNNILTDGERSAATAEVLELFDVIVESSKVGARKPEVQFYEMACDLLDVEPANCVFLDDLGVNLKPARAMGMTTIKVIDHERALAELEGVLGHPV
ncbi:MAG: HAD-IA family hydrolase [Acidimicrobiales bacterium]|nr:HAD-IA family hydrolase [Acidimicrobiales bacterium]